MSTSARLNSGRSLALRERWYISVACAGVIVLPSRMDTTSTIGSDIAAGAAAVATGAAVAAGATDCRTLGYTSIDRSTVLSECRISRIENVLSRGNVSVLEPSA